MGDAGTGPQAVIQSVEAGQHNPTPPGGRTVPSWPSMTVKEAAEYTGYHPEHIRRLCRKGKLDFTRAGNVYLIRVKSLTDYLESLDRTDGRAGPKHRS